MDKYFLVMVVIILIIIIICRYHTFNIVEGIMSDDEDEGEGEGEDDRQSFLRPRAPSSGGPGTASTIGGLPSSEHNPLAQGDHYAEPAWGTKDNPLVAGGDYVPRTGGGG